MSDNSDPNPGSTPAVSKASNFQPTQKLPTSASPTSFAKEQKEGFIPIESGKAQAVEIKEPQPPKEVATWMEKIEKGEEIQLPSPVLDDYGQILVQSAAPQQPRIVLPLDEKTLNQGLAQKVVESIRWLAEWCWRLVKMNPKRVEYRKRN